MIRFLYDNHIYDDKFKKPFEEGGMSGNVDLPRLKRGKSGGAFWSAYVPCPKNITDFSDENYADGELDLQHVPYLCTPSPTYPHELFLHFQCSTCS